MLQPGTKKYCSGKDRPFMRLSRVHRRSRGKDEVYVASFPIPTKGSGRFQTAVVISHAGATTERNSCTSPDGKLMSVEVVLSPSFKASAPNSSSRLRFMPKGHRI